MDRSGPCFYSRSELTYESYSPVFRYERWDKSTAALGAVSVASLYMGRNRNGTVLRHHFSHQRQRVCVLRCGSTLRPHIYSVLHGGTPPPEVPSLCRRAAESRHDPGRRFSLYFCL